MRHVWAGAELRVSEAAGRKETQNMSIFSKTVEKCYLRFSYGPNQGAVAGKAGMCMPGVTWANTSLVFFLQAC